MTAGGLAPTAGTGSHRGGLAWAQVRFPPSGGLLSVWSLQRASCHLALGSDPCPRESHCLQGKALADSRAGLTAETPEATTARHPALSAAICPPGSPPGTAPTPGPRPEQDAGGPGSHGGVCGSPPSLWGHTRLSQVPPLLAASAGPGLARRMWFRGISGRTTFIQNEGLETHPPWPQALYGPSPTSPTTPGCLRWGQVGTQSRGEAVGG